MQPSEIILTYLPGMAAIGTVAYLVYERIYNGSSKIRESILKDYEIRLKQLETQKADFVIQIEQIQAKHTEQISKLYSELASFKATILEKDKHIASLTDILQGRNPELIQVIGEIKGGIEQNKSILDYQTKILETKLK